MSELPEKSNDAAATSQRVMLHSLCGSKQISDMSAGASGAQP